MKRSLFLSLVCLVFTASAAFSQTFEVPVDYSLTTEADYVKYEKDVIAAANWLKSTPPNEQSDKRKAVSGFILAWTSGTPSVNVEIVPIIMDFEKKNTGMLVLYMASSAKYVLEHNYSKDMRAKHQAALLDMIAVYKAGKGINKDKKMDKLIDSEAKGQLGEWIEENISVTN